MNSFEFNKMFAAILVALLVAMFAGFVADKVVKPTALEKNSYVVEGVAASSSAAPEAAAPKGPEPIAPLLAKASAEAGQKAARVCGACHNFAKGEPAKIGPNLYDIVGAKPANMPGYSYSEGMKKMTGTWSYEDLNEFLYNPRAHTPGTKMTFAGIKNDQERANVIAWLRTLSGSPVPLPK